MHLEVMREVFEELGGEILFTTPAQQLVQDDSGKVTGVIAESDDRGTIQVNAKNGVIICTGGYGANTEMLNDLCPGNSKWCGLTSATTETGDGIRMALWAGAELEAGGACMIWNRAILPDGFEFTDERTGAPSFLPGSQPFLHVNANGERFMNEDQCYPMSYAAARTSPAIIRGSSGTAATGRTSSGSTRAAARGLFPAPSGTAFKRRRVRLRSHHEEHLDSFWLAPQIESGALKQCDHPRRAGRGHGL